jgi:CubicO group peptidase (beta-lactamase class C family)
MKTRLIIGGIFVALVVGCGKDPAPLDIQQPVAPQPVVSRPDFEESFLQRLDDVVSAPVRDGKILNAVYLLDKDGRRVRSGFYGAHSMENDTPVTDKSIYRIYSMTKLVTAVAMMKLYEQGKFNLDDPVSKYLPELAGLEVLRRVDAFGNPVTSPPAHPPTMGELLTHTAGFGYVSGRSDYVNARIDRDGVLNKRTLDEMTRSLAKIPLAYEPGTSWEYSIASDVQGAVIERITGQSLGAFMKAEIFTPLGLRDTGFSIDSADAARLTAPTAWTEEGGRTDIGEPLRNLANPGAQLESGGLGLVSTLSDLERFLQMLAQDGELDGVRVLTPQSVALITANALPVVDPYSGEEAIGPGFGRGFGFGVGVVTDQRMSGLTAPNATYYWDGASGTWFWVDRENDIVFIGLVQNFSPQNFDHRKRTMEMVYRALN